jgi:hypothetical protein
MEDYGYRPLGKFSSARDSILHFLCTNEWANDHTGNSMDWNVYAWRITNEEFDVQGSNHEFGSIMEQWFEDNPEVTDSPELRAELVGHFCVVEYSGGHVGVAKYNTEAELIRDFQIIEAEYNEWDEQTNGDGVDIHELTEED